MLSTPQRYMSEQQASRQGVSNLDPDIHGQELFGPYCIASEVDPLQVTVLA